MSSPSLAVVGSANVDVISFLERPPEPGETVRARGGRIGPGGKGANQAVAVSRLGATVELVARVGRDPFGKVLRAALLDAGVGVAGVEVSPALATGVASILVEPDGENRIVFAAGANAELDASQAKRALARLERLDCMVGCFEVGDEPLLAAARIARARGAAIVLNAAPARPLPSQFLALLDWIVLNETEFRELRGVAPEGATLGAAAAAWDCGVVVTLGARGAMLTGPRGATTTCPATPIVPVETTGAGDAFVGAFAWALARGEDELRALELGVAAGSLSAGRAGIQDSFPGREELLAAA